MRKIVILILGILLLQMFATVYAWELERPGTSVKILERVDSSDTNGEVSTSQQLIN